MVEVVILYFVNSWVSRLAVYQEGKEVSLFLFFYFYFVMDSWYECEVNLFTLPSGA